MRRKLDMERLEGTLHHDERLIDQYSVPVDHMSKKRLEGSIDSY